MKYEIDKLKNDLEVIFVDLPGSSAATAQIWFRAGSTLEDKEDHGIAHFLEHMFFKGTPTRPGAMIAHEVESFGGEINAFTSFDYTCYYINTPNSHLNQTVNILLDMVSNPMFKEEDLIPEREVVFEEYRRSQDNPNQFSFQKIQKSCFSGGYAHPILGNEKTIKSFTQDQLKKFRNKYYNNSNSFLVVAGDMREKAKIIKTIENFSLPEGQATDRPAFKLKKKPAIEIHNKDVRMCQLTLTIQSPSMDSAKAAAEDLAYNTLGHGESSPLHKGLVLDGSIANNCASSTMFFSKGGIHFLRVNYPVENHKKVMTRLQKTLANVINKGLTQEDITKIKNQYVAAKLYEKESIESFSFSLGSSYAQTLDLENENEFVKKVKKTSLKQVNNAYKDIFSRPIHLSLQLPKGLKAKDYKSDLEKFQKSFAKYAKAQKEEKLKVTKSKYDPSALTVELKPGITLLYRNNPMTPTFVMHAYIKGALTEELPKNNGIYNLMTSQLTKGYKGMPQEKLKHDLESKSAMLGHFSGKNAFGLTLHGQTEHYKALVKHFMGSLLTPAFPNKSLTHEKKLILRNLEAQKEDATRHCFKAATEELFKGHPYARGIIGSEKTVKALKKADLEALHGKNLKSKEMLFTYCGDLSLEEVIEHLSPYIDTLKKRPAKPLKAKKVTPMKSKNIHIDFDREQTQIFIGTQSPSLNKKENVVLKMLTTHLSGQSSELFVDVRDRKGLCYVAQPVHMNALEAGYWGIYMASGHDKVDQAVDAIKAIIQKTKENGLTEDEFNRIKVMIEGQNQINLQVNEDYANVYSVPTLQGQGLDYFHKSNEQISTLSYEEFQKNIKKVLSKNWITVTVGR
jgi:zinc protease